MLVLYLNRNLDKQQRDKEDNKIPVKGEKIDI